MSYCIVTYRIVVLYHKWQILVAILRFGGMEHKANNNNMLKSLKKNYFHDMSPLKHNHGFVISWKAQHNLFLKQSPHLTTCIQFVQHRVGWEWASHVWISQVEHHSAAAQGRGSILCGTMLSCVMDVCGPWMSLCSGASSCTPASEYALGFRPAVPNLFKNSQLVQESKKKKKRRANHVFFNKATGILIF